MENTTWLEGREGKLGGCLRGSDGNAGEATEPNKIGCFPRLDAGLELGADLLEYH